MTFLIQIRLIKNAQICLQKRVFAKISEFIPHYLLHKMDLGIRTPNFIKTSYIFKEEKEMWKRNKRLAVLGQNYLKKHHSNIQDNKI